MPIQLIQCFISFQLPFGLNDPAVIKEYLGQKVINQQLYEKVKVTFLQENGGKDFEDVFVYWIHAESKTVDFLAYSYLTDGGGVRFRQAINRRNHLRYANFRITSTLNPKAKRLP